MDVKYDFSDFEKFIMTGKKEVMNKEQEIADNSVKHAVETGNYQDRTGKLRKSNKYKIDESGITLYNDAENQYGTKYASFVETKGFTVLSSAALKAEKDAQKEFER